MGGQSEPNIFLEAYEGRSDNVLQSLQNDKSLLVAVDSNDRMLVHWASLGGHTELVRLLLSAGSPFDPQDDMLMTPLILASSAGRLDTVRLLVSVGANVNSQNAQGHSSLQYAASKGWKEIVQFLLDEGAEVNMADVRGARPLHRASSIGNLPIVTVLLSCNNIEINPRDSEGNTPLHLSCEEDRVEVAKLLVERGAQLDAVNKAKKTPLDYATAGLAKILQSLVE